MIAVGAPQDVGRGYNAGAVYVYQNQSGAWSRYDKKLFGDASSQFGTAVAINSYVSSYSNLYGLLVGAPVYSKVYNYTLDTAVANAEWLLRDTLTGGGDFGAAVDSTNNSYWRGVGAPG